ncbi:hypothetical protein [Granulicatella adiacens]|uniref:hypothetical protein n=1 Tax=Granulicatella adiacens TaxID=46124 RepID=UPI0025996EF4|nr:hypothetical protein [uncultured Granulicatella sp.]
MSKKGKILVFVLIFIGVILVELSMYVVPFMDEIKALEGPLFVAGMLLLLGMVYFLNKRNANNKEWNQMKKSFSESFGESIKQNVGDIVIDTSEAILDSCINEGIMKEIPILKYFVTVGKVYDDIKGRTFLTKMRIFIQSFNAGCASEDDVQKRREMVYKKNRNEELAYISVIIDSFLDFEKPEILAKLYLAYLDQHISWNEFCAYSEITNSLLRMDIDYLKNNQTVSTKNNIITSELLRLTGSGMMYSYQNDSPWVENEQGYLVMFESGFERVSSKERIFSRTEFGEKYINIILSYK